LKILSTDIHNLMKRCGFLWTALKLKLGSLT
jgi:hypothetical protein